ncbi:MAG: EAL domain-containing protein [Pseudomonadota bacterium]
MRVEDIVQSYAHMWWQAVALFEVAGNDQGNTQLFWCNEAFEQVTGHSQNTLLGGPLSALSGPHTSQADLDTIANGLKTEKPFLHEIQYSRGSGKPYWAELTFTFLPDLGRSNPCWLLYLRDVSSVRTRENAARQALDDRAALENQLHDYKEQIAMSEQRLWNAIEALPDGFVIYDKDDNLLICNEKFERTYDGIADIVKPGVSFEKLLDVGIERGVFPDAVGRETEWRAERLEHHRNPTGFMDQELPGDRYVRVHESLTSNGDIVGFRVDITDIKRQQRRLEKFASALESAKSRIQKQALLDPLTGLANRRQLDEYLSRYDRRQFDRKGEIALLQVDLDRFKHINDTFGHAAGDQVLMHVAELIRSVTIESDLIARIGGDEFVIVCEDLTTPDRPAEIAAQIIDELQAPVIYEGKPCCRVGASIGIAFADSDKVDRSKLLINADIALYRAKRDGRNNVVIFTEELEAEIVRTKLVADEILRGIENNEFVAYYQPQFDARNHDLVGVETLVRWNHPEKGILAPFHFLGIAEELDVVSEIDRLTFEQAVKTSNVLEERGFSIPKVAVNVSFRRLADPRLIESIEAFPSTRSKVSFELLETIFLDEQHEAINWNIDRLRECGVEIEIDDFGSGRASIIGLTKVNPDRLKIDRQLVFPVTESELQRSLVKAIIEMGHSLGISVVAEGVETLGHANVLRDLGVDVLQGYAFAKPMPFEEFEDFLKNETWRNAA